MKNLSIRARFTLFYTLLLAATLALFGILLFAVQAKTTLDGLKHDLTKSSSFISSILESDGSLPAQPPTPPSSQDQEDEHGLGRLPERELLRVLATDGTLIAAPRGGATASLPLQPTELMDLAEGEDTWMRTMVDGTEYLVLNHPVTLPSGQTYIIQAARPLIEQQRNLQYLLLGLLGFSAVMVLIALAVGWWFSGVTLSPIQKITQTAEAIGAEKDFGKRVVYDGPRDEVGQLAHTFNDMLGQLEESYSKVAHSLEMQRGFVADVSHELRTPLTTLSGNIGLLRRTPPLPESERADILADISDEADRMIRLVNELLVLARADAGRHLNIAAFDPAGVMEEAARQARILAPGRQVSLLAQPGTIALGDKDAAKQALLIGLDNALKHSSGDITLRLQQQGGQVAISVEDSGEGIDPARLPYLFDRFYRGEEAATIPGFGLGLPIARSLAQGMGGDVQMFSEPGKGTQLVITLPLAHKEHTIKP